MTSDEETRRRRDEAQVMEYCRFLFQIGSGISRYWVLQFWISKGQSNLCLGVFVSALEKQDLFSDVAVFLIIISMTHYPKVSSPSCIHPFSITPAFTA